MFKPSIELIIDQKFRQYNVNNPELQRALTEALKEICDYERIKRYIWDEMNKELRRSGLRL